MLQEIEKIRDFHFVKKCKLSNEGCQLLDDILKGTEELIKIFVTSIKTAEKKGK
jgi:hypothetical protein